MFTERASTMGCTVLGLAFLLLSGTACATSVALADVGEPDPPIEEGFVTAINELRAAEGIDTLVVNDGLVGAAREWASEMVGERKLAHADNITTGVPLGWTKAGENVGRGNAVGELMDAFMASPGHRRNVLDPDFNQVGVGSFLSGEGVLYTAHRFAQAPLVSGASPTHGAFVEVDCPDGHGRIVLSVANDGSDSSQVSAIIGSSAEQSAELAPGTVEAFEASFQPDGAVDAIARIDGEVIFADTIDVSC